jgi:hypothetical protein
MGKRIGVKFAEGFTTQKNIGVKSLQDILLNET